VSAHHDPVLVRETLAFLAVVDSCGSRAVDAFND
jgi:hypothetical protein